MFVWTFEGVMQAIVLGINFIPNIHRWLFWIGMDIRNLRKMAQ
jgi:hypothetical protein